MNMYEGEVFKKITETQKPPWKLNIMLIFQNRHQIASRQLNIFVANAVLAFIGTFI